MNTTVAVLSLILCTLALLAAPLLPAFIELRRKSDAAPLQIIDEYDVDIHCFANNFRRYIENNYHGAFQHCDDRQKPFYGIDKEGKKYVIITKDHVELSDEEKQAQITSRIIFGCHSLRLPGAMSYLSELYARESVFGGEEDIYRAILAEKDIYLASQSMLLRWLHAGRELLTEKDCVLHGRVSADDLIHLAAGCHFERLYAPRIEFGEHIKKYSTPPLTITTNANLLARQLFQHDAEVPDGDNIESNLVVTQSLQIGAGCCINGSVKSHRTMHIENGTRIFGSTVTESDLYIGDECLIMGPVVAEGNIFIGRGCQIGFAEHPTTITAKRILTKSGVLAHGTVWAHEHGIVVE